MPRGNTSKYTNKQKRQAKKIEEGYEKGAVPVKAAASQAWATVNKESGGGKKSGSSSTARKAASPRGSIGSERSQTARSSGSRKPVSRRASPSRSRRSSR
jgi:hypothetical protein